MKKLLKHNAPFTLESGKVLPGLEITYHAFGSINEEKNNIVWICHNLTANSDAADWWKGLVAPGQLFDPAKYFVVCANMPGSCYGSSGPLSTDPLTGNPYYSTFPELTIRDMVNAYILLRKHLGIDKITFGVGGSMGGFQILEWAVMEPGIFRQLILLSTAARESAWAIAIHTAQRLAIEADHTWKDMRADAGQKGLKAARAIGMLTYRNYRTFVALQTDEHAKLDNHKASSYIHYQGEKLVKRFNAYSYWLLSKAMDSHHLGRGRGSIEQVLGSIATDKTLVVGISSDILCPVEQQQFLAEHIPGAVYVEIDSPYGHDAFLIEWARLGEIIRNVFRLKP